MRTAYVRMVFHSFRTVNSDVCVSCTQFYAYRVRGSYQWYAPIFHFNVYLHVQRTFENGLTFYKLVKTYHLVFLHGCVVNQGEF